MLLSLIYKLLPLYSIVLIGFISGRYFNVSTKFVSKLLFFILIPLVVFFGIWQSNLKQSLTISLMVLLLCSSMYIPAILAKKFFWPKGNINFISCAFGYLNVGWFGIPTAFILFGQKSIPLIVSAYVGNIIYGNTIGYYLISRTQGSAIKAIKGVLTLPSFYAFLFGAIANLSELKIPMAVSNVIGVTKWILSFFGMMIIGLSISKLPLHQFRPLFFLKILSFKYLIGPVFALLLLIGEALLIHKLDLLSQKIIFLVSFFPVAANLVVFSSFLETETENASIIVLISTFVSFAIIPIFSIFLL